ncbi:LysM peptidoglycan-binding domain-containing protein [Flammeovirga aprica]|uniref:LysM peptidoglycan-binding domain-containing protein n=1 Tax=Flammeovirga aprica JL-4 TaxID=694437 RepID=A0A7X9P0M8_9BACT|nr:LysM peptidoglycan-binding domain-containing protein [Flammeovirga aprica]NME67145.1 LysM peptidoglycan-binding domain-containing protein [Flammeovirga aprica JL-4]
MLLRRIFKYTFAFIFSLSFTIASAQDEGNVLPTWKDSLYTVALPEGYLMPSDTLEIVEAAPYAPWFENFDEFDTTEAILVDISDQTYDYVPNVSDSLVRERLSEMQMEIPLTYHDRVRLFIDYFSVRRRDYTLSIIQRKQMYFPMFERIFEEEGVPTELKYLAVIESALKPVALSRVGAKGLWQFMPRTGRAYGLKQTYQIDDRMDPEKATRAAAKYLKFLYNYHGDWELAIAAYNCGPGNIRKAQRRSGKKKFWDIYRKLPRETRSYLPQYVAMAYVLTYAEEHNLIQDLPMYEIPAEDIFVSQSIDLGKLADELNVCREDLQLMNASLRFGFAPNYVKNFRIRIPEARFEYYLENQEEILANVKYTGEGANIGDGYYYHYVRRGESLGLIASRHRVKTSNLRAWNNIRGNTIYPGQKLKIYGNAYSPGPSKKSTSSAKKTTTSTPKKTSGASIYHTVRSGETLGVIAKKYRVYVADIQKLNNLKGTRINVGQKLLIKQGKYEAPEASAPSTTAVTKTASKPAVTSSNGTLVYHTVRSGETLGGIAEKYNTSASKLRSWNGMRGSTIYKGQKLKVYTTSSTTTSNSTVKNTSSSKSNNGYGPSANTRYHTVKSGDSLTEIAKSYRVYVKDIKRVNNMSGSSINVGQRLTIPPSPASVLNEGKTTQTTSSSESGYYTVKNGDTLWQIAQDNGVSVSEIKRLNNMKSNKLKVGQRLKIKS